MDSAQKHQTHFTYMELLDHTIGIPNLITFDVTMAPKPCTHIVIL